MCRLLLEHVSEKNPGDRNGETPLHKAAQGGHLEVCKLFYENIELKSPVNRYGQTPLHKAVPYCEFKVCRFFLESGMDMNIVDNCGRSPRSIVESGNLIDPHKNHRKMKKLFKSYDENHRQLCVIQWTSVKFFIPQELPLYNVSVTAQSDEIPKFWTILPVVYATESHV